jgi:flagellar basal body-associated protein FliL
MATSTTTIIIIIAVVVLLLAMIGVGAIFTIILCRRKHKPSERGNGECHRQQEVQKRKMKTQNKTFDGKIGERERSHLNPSREPVQLE